MKKISRPLYIMIIIGISILLAMTWWILHPENNLAGVLLAVPLITVLMMIRTKIDSETIYRVVDYDTTPCSEIQIETNRDSFAVSERFTLDNIEVETVSKRCFDFFNMNKIEATNYTFENLKRFQIGGVYTKKYGTGCILIELSQSGSDVILDFSIPRLPRDRGGYYVSWWPNLVAFCDFIGIKHDQTIEHVKAIVKSAHKLWAGE